MFESGYIKPSSERDRGTLKQQIKTSKPGGKKRVIVEKPDAMSKKKNFGEKKKETNK